MRILVVSDTHGDDWALRRAVAEQPEAKLVFHLGDGVEEALTVAEENPRRTFLIVRGNNDWRAGRSVPETGVYTAAEKRIFYTHGHRYDAKAGLYRLIGAAREQQADILLFGHTHAAMTDYDDGLYILNPGSLAYGHPGYGIIDITDAGIAMHTVRCRW